MSRRKRDDLQRGVDALRRVAGEMAQKAASREWPAWAGMPDLGIAGWEAVPRDAQVRRMDFRAAADGMALFARGWIDALGLDSIAAWSLLDVASRIAAGMRRRSLREHD